MDRHSLLSEVYDLPFVNAVRTVVDFDIVNDFVHSLTIDIGRTSLEDFWHLEFGFGKPVHRSVEVFAEKDEGVTSVDG